MKKFSLLLTLVVATALLLSACGGATNVNNTPLPGDDTGLPTTDLMLTPELEVTDDAGAMDVTPEVTTEETTEATTEATEGATLDVTETVEATDEAAMPGATDDVVLLSDLLTMQVNGMDGQSLGMVTGAVIDRSAVLSDVTTTGEDVAGSDASTDMAIAGQNPRISYLQVSVDGESTDTTALGNGVLVPFQAFATTAGSSDVAGSDTTSEGALTLNIDAAALADVPDFTGDVAAAEWDADVAQYWSDQGLAIPMTGVETAVANGSVLVQGSLGELSINGMDDAPLGNVSDLVVDLQTGDILYAILSGGETFGTNFYAVPFSQLNWMAGEGDATMGSFGFSQAPDAFMSAPSFTSVDEFDSTMLDEAETYWQGLTTP